MAEDKKIKVSVDYSELDQLRERMRSLMAEMNKLQNSTTGVGMKALTPDQFQSYTDRVVSIQEQALRYISEKDNQFRALDDIYQRFSNSYQSFYPNWRSGLTPPVTSAPDRVADTGANRTIWDRIVGFLSRITDNMEREERDRKNGDVPVGNAPPRTYDVPSKTPSQPSATTGGGGLGERLKGFRLPTSMSGLLGLLAGGFILDQIGQLVSEQLKFSATQANMPDEFQREINRGNNPLLNRFTFGIPAAQAQKRMHNYQVAQQFDRSVVGFAQAFGQSYDSSVGSMFSFNGGLGEGISFERDIYNGNLEGRTNEYGVGNNVSMYSQSAGVGGNPISALFNTRDEKRERGVLNRDIGERGRSNWASITLGLDMSEYQDKYTRFSQAGVGNRAGASGFGVGISSYDMNRLMVAQRYRGLSDSDIENIQRASRYSFNRTGVESMAALDTQLQRYAQNVLGYNSANSQLYASTMLPESIQRFSELSNIALQTQGGFDAASTLRQMSSIQNATGARGQRLERYQDAFMGMGISQDDVSQAILIRAARGLDPNASYSDIMEDIESVRSGQNMPLAKEFLKYIESATGGEGEQFRNMLKTVFPNLSWADVNNYERLDKDKRNADVLFGSGSSTGSMYSDQQAKQMVSATERSGAETRNAQAEKGYEDIYRMMGQDLQDVIDGSQIAKDIRAITDVVVGGTTGSPEKDVEKQQSDWNEAMLRYKLMSSGERLDVTLSRE